MHNTSSGILCSKSNRNCRKFIIQKKVISLDIKKSKSPTVKLFFFSTQEATTAQNGKPRKAKKRTFGKRSRYTLFISMVPESSP